MNLKQRDIQEEYVADPVITAGQNQSPSISTICAQIIHMIQFCSSLCIVRTLGGWAFSQERVASLKQMKHIEKENLVDWKSAVPIWMLSLAFIPFSSGTSVPLQAVNTSKRSNEALRTMMFKSVVRCISKWLVQSYRVDL